MSPDSFRNALILTGPTASGKSAVGVALAERLNAEIISMDSMALYRGMDIGTAKPSAEERSRVPHHLIDVRDPWESASLAWWLVRAAECLADIERRGRRGLFVGGTPLYLKGLLRGIFEGPSADPDLRLRLEQCSGAELHERLQRVDPPTAERLHPNDVRRLVRALEVLELTGKPISEWQLQFDQVQPRSHSPVWLDWPRPVLYRRIDLRVETMIHSGLLDEVRRLKALATPLSKEARQALGYKELWNHLDGKESLEAATVRIQTRSRNFAKRQMTWFRSLAECQRLPIEEGDSMEAIAVRVLEVWQ